MTETPTKRKRDAVSGTINGDVFLEMARHLSSIDPKGSNVVFSPLSLRATLSLVAAGASDPAAEQLLSFLNSDSVDDLNEQTSKLAAILAAADGPDLSLANGVWIHKGYSLKPSFKQVVDDFYKAEISQVDFVSKADDIVSEVNSWAREKTKGLISKVLDFGSVEASDRLILANALYFKGAWFDTYFSKSTTKEDDFHLLGGDSVKVPFMTSNYNRHSVHTHPGFKVLGIRYWHRIDAEPLTKEWFIQSRDETKTRFSLYILLPDSLDGLASLSERVASEPGFLEKHLIMKDRRDVLTVVRIPKFKVSFGFKACDIIKQLGVTKPFKLGGIAKMAHSDEEGDALFVSEIFQDAFIEVNEEGTTAAALTRAMFGGGSGGMPPPTVEFVADHPFIFLIREEVSGAVLFFGHVLNPLK